MMHSVRAGIPYHWLSWSPLVPWMAPPSLLHASWQWTRYWYSWLWYMLHCPWSDPTWTPRCWGGFVWCHICRMWVEYLRNEKKIFFLIMMMMMMMMIISTWRLYHSILIREKPFDLSTVASYMKKKPLDLSNLASCIREKSFDLSTIASYIREKPFELSTVASYIGEKPFDLSTVASYIGETIWPLYCSILYRGETTWPL